MAATTTPTPAAPRDRGFRLSTMEVLGFIETPGSALSSTITWIDTTAEHIPQPPVTDPVSDDPFSGWHPEDFVARLTRGRVRWGMVAAVSGMLVFLGLSGLWVYQRPQIQAESARQAVLVGVSELESALDGLAQVNETLTASAMDAVEVNTVMLSGDAAVRQVFAAAANLPSSLGMAKARLLDATGDASDALRLFGDAYAYRSGTIPLLVLPTLESDPGLTTLEEAADAFSQWQARFEAVRSALPDGPLTGTATALASLSDELPGIQRSYLDGLRLEDVGTAQDAVDQLAVRLSAVESALFDDLAEVQAGVVGLLRGADADLAAVSSLLG